MIVVTLVLVLLMADGKVTNQAREMPDLLACRQAEDSAHDAAKNSFDVIDVGTICLESNFDPSHKPPA